MSEDISHNFHNSNSQEKIQSVLKKLKIGISLNEFTTEIVDFVEIYRKAAEKDNKTLPSCLTTYNFMLHIKGHEITGSLKLPFRCMQMQCSENCKKGNYNFDLDNTISNENNLDQIVDNENNFNNTNNNIDKLYTQQASNEENYAVAVAMVAELRANSSIPFCVMPDIISSYNVMTHCSLSDLSNKICLTVQEIKGISETSKQALLNKLMPILDNARSPLEFIKTRYQQDSFFEKHQLYAKPESVLFGQSFECHNGKDRLMYDSFQYVSIEATLRSLLLDNDFCSLLFKAPTQNFDLAEFYDANLYASHSLFADKNKKSVMIQLFYDGMGTTNPLRGQSTLFNIGVFYYTFKNLPNNLNSCFSNVHLLALCYSEDLKYFGFDLVLNKFKAEITKLQNIGFNRVFPLLVSIGNAINLFKRKMNSLEEKLCEVLKVDRLPQELVTKLLEEAMDLNSFVLVNENDLVELGFKMGQRKLIIPWLQSCAVVPIIGFFQPQAETLHELSPVLNLIAAPIQRNIPFTPSSNLYPVKEVLFKNDNSSANVHGPTLVTKLLRGEIYSIQERHFLVRILGRYLMEVAKVKDMPSKEEKLVTAVSIVAGFPCLKSKLTESGHEYFYCGKSHTGHIEIYVRQRRSRSKQIITKWNHRKEIPHCRELVGEENCEVERMLRERRPTALNQEELLHMMAESRIFRRDWILNIKPNATLILKRYPRFLDMNETIRQEFSFLVGEFKDIRNQWSLCRDTILQLAVTASEKDEDLKEELFCISAVENEFDEGIN
ncbi:uncharacterized protein LOC124815486 isoform X2 [Hydra vulgaris]|uniref:Uncharacterized protein LOC124815486 isoform X2 n=1 Tax=Hydra vulgaris TaxID=6087 RepID=A0ABM4DCX1_HYDVU